jgi:dTDP-4-dehydrorhamnose 3,5-epimerase/CDP-3, 6-dideoxy-D-glycero-D-glycero-4-hexulose-5-epimerase
VNFVQTKIKDCFLIDTKSFLDERGSFTKLYHQLSFEEHGISITLREQFYTISNKHVLRGMHFQIPPYDHCKLVTCLSGRVLDVILDLRKDSKTYGQVESFELSAETGQILYLPKGIAHGFLSLEDNSGMLYGTTKEHMPEADRGIKWDSFGFDWPYSNCVISDRDLSHPTFEEFNNPF